MRLSLIGTAEGAAAELDAMDPQALPAEWQARGATTAMSAALLGKSEIAVQEALDEIQRELPFRLLGVDSDKWLGVHQLAPQALVR